MMKRKLVSEVKRHRQPTQIAVGTTPAATNLLKLDYTYGIVENNYRSCLVAEYSTVLNPTPQVAYLMNDHVGSPRINIDENGRVTARHDYRPYGEEVTERTHSQYVGDTIRKQFTGYEHDGETDLDFAQARDYNARLGRFTAADAVSNDTQAGDPASWNLYVYVRNGPDRYVDPTGKELWFIVNGVNYRYTICDGQGVFVEEDGVKYGGDDKTVKALGNLLERFRGDNVGTLVYFIGDTKKNYFVVGDLDSSIDGSIGQSSFNGTTPSQITIDSDAASGSPEESESFAALGVALLTKEWLLMSSNPDLEQPFDRNGVRQIDDYHDRSLTWMQAQQQVFHDQLVGGQGSTFGGRGSNPNDGTSNPRPYASGGLPTRSGCDFDVDGLTRMKVKR